VSRALPFRWHHPIKKFFWGGEEEGYLSRRVQDELEVCAAATCSKRTVFGKWLFSYLDDLSTLGQFRIGSRLELWWWRVTESTGTALSGELPARGLSESRLVRLPARNR
jgi:hypothetical protein